MFVSHIKKRSGQSLSQKTESELGFKKWAGEEEGGIPSRGNQVSRVVRLFQNSLHKAVGGLEVPEIWVV